MGKKSADRFAAFRDESSHEYPPPPSPAVPAAPTTPTAVSPAASPAPVGPVVSEEAPPERRERVLSDKVAFSSRISPAQAKLLAQLVRETGKPQTRLLEEAFVLLFKHYKGA